MKTNQFLKSDVESAARKINSAEELSIMLLEALRDGDYEEATSLAGSIKVLSEDISRMENKGRLYETAMKMQQRGINLAVISRCLG
ncbi:YqaH family protein [Bacillus subtilis]|uniref:YqaH family protein n=1 Tax=Bacillus subtilis TaxID=1423 RepID=UPI002DB7AAB9|nr:YqaH family protein [Bacillus subtilis]MEC3621575.1 YqaH family protein [Bacillus subtilis]MEC3633422.1 YqaH family protein [Bacillus subtilis]MEC3643832.1 YqaH family protein [Bacillus subtilis]MEC3648827.1 YqaH family protein [Bacillus subtilis]MEC3699017.1 YqaH family protein [Bacillus subtilis]